MEKSGFFNSVDDDRTYDAGDFAAYYGDLFSNGIFYSRADSLMVSAGIGMQLNVSAGSAWVNGYRYFNTANAPLTVQLATGSANRIDRVALRWSLGERRIYLVVLRGVEAAAPVAPELTRTADVFELGLADIGVPKGAGMISQGYVTDTRLNPLLCGISMTRSYLTDGGADAEAMLEKLSELERRMLAAEAALSHPTTDVTRFTRTLIFTHQFPNQALPDTTTTVTVYQTVYHASIKSTSTVVTNELPVKSVAEGSCQVAAQITGSTGFESRTITVNFVVYN